MIGAKQNKNISLNIENYLDVLHLKEKKETITFQLEYHRFVYVEKMTYRQLDRK